MTHHVYFRNFFLALAASQSDDEFLAFAEAVLANLEKDPEATADAVFLKPLVADLRKAHAQRGPVGTPVVSAATLRGAVKEFLAWVQFTNTTKVFPVFPKRYQIERLDILPGGMTHLYEADHTNILERARYYLDKVGTTYASQTTVTAADAQAQYDKLVVALTGRSTDEAKRRQGAAAVDEEEENVCRGLYRAYAGLLYRYPEQPEQAYAMFPFPNTTGDPATDDNLPSLPTTPH
jgi:hypothetical protein